MTTGSSVLVATSAVNALFLDSVKCPRSPLHSTTQPKFLQPIFFFVFNSPLFEIFRALMLS